MKSQYCCHLSPKAEEETALVGAKVGGFLLTVFSVSNYIILDIYIQCLWMTASHSVVGTAAEDPED